jgi:DNA-directed RNA polymerase subunit RPC12/RpoP
MMFSDNSELICAKCNAPVLWTNKSTTHNIGMFLIAGPLAGGLSQAYQCHTCGRWFNDIGKAIRKRLVLKRDKPVRVVIVNGEAQRA